MLTFILGILGAYLSPNFGPDYEKSETAANKVFNIIEYPSLINAMKGKVG